MEKLPISELVARLDTARQQIPIGSKWVHYKGGKYIVFDLIIYEVSNEVGIVYGSADHAGVKFSRALSVWQEMVDWHGMKVFRFRPDIEEPRAFDIPTVGSSRE